MSTFRESIMFENMLYRVQIKMAETISGIQSFIERSNSTIQPITINHSYQQSTESLLNSTQLHSTTNSTDKREIEDKKREIEEYEREIEEYEREIEEYEREIEESERRIRDLKKEKKELKKRTTTNKTTNYQQHYGHTDKSCEIGKQPNFQYQQFYQIKPIGDMKIKSTTFLKLARTSFTQLINTCICYNENSKLYNNNI